MRLTLRIALIATVMAVAGFKFLKRATDTPVGMRVLIPGWPPMTAASCGGDNDGTQIHRVPEIILKVSENRVFSMNAEPVSNEALHIRLRDTYATRAEKVLFLEADPALGFQDVANTIDAAVGSVEHLDVVLISPKAAKEPCWGLNSPRPLPPLPVN
jgi:hypothetical protein